jgi:hypothetical protein
MQRGAQLLVLPQARLGFAEGPVFVAHQQQHRQQLRLGELMLTEAGAVGWQNLRGHLQCHASKGQESNSVLWADCVAVFMTSSSLS